MYKLSSANDAWLDLIEDISLRGNSVAPRGLPCRELLAHTTHVRMDSPVVTIKERKLGRRFLVAEAWWILTGRNDVASIAPYSKEISKFSNDGRRFDGAYGVKVVDQLRYVCDALVEDNDTRQAVMTIWRENPRSSKDVPCTISCQFFIRKIGGARYLECIDVMRSSDAWLGIVYDWFNFSMLSALVLLTVKERDPLLCDVKLGGLSLFAGSEHLYESNLSQVESILSSRGAEAKDLYDPLNLEEFSSPEDFLNHLEMLKDRKDSGHQWLRELILENKA